MVVMPRAYAGNAAQQESKLHTEFHKVHANSLRDYRNIDITLDIIINLLGETLCTTWYNSVYGLLAFRPGRLPKKPDKTVVAPSTAPYPPPA